jgi:hypothetical protein
MEKSLYAAPIGIEQESEMPDIEIEIEDPESVKIGIDGLEIEIGKDEEDNFDENIAEKLDER